MSIASGFKIDWIDIQNIYTDLNSARTKFNMATVTIPSNPGLIYSSHLTDLAALVDAMSSNSYIGTNANTGVSSQTPGNYIYPTQFSRIDTIVTNIKDNICPHNAAHYASHRSGYNGSYYSTHRSSYDGSYYSTHRSGYNGSYYSTHRSSYDGTYRSHNGNYYSSHRSGYNGTYRSHHADYDSGCDSK